MMIVIEQRMFCGAQYTLHTFTPIITQQTKLQPRKLEKVVRWELNGFMTLFKVKITIKQLL